MIKRDDGNNIGSVNTTASPAKFYDKTLNVTGLTGGKFYWFGLIAVNENGDSEMSDISYFAAATDPVQPTVLYKDVEKSNKTSISLYWPKTADT